VVGVAGKSRVQRAQDELVDERDAAITRLDGLRSSKSTATTASTPP